jgi:hypothetical protein
LGESGWERDEREKRRRATRIAPDAAASTTAARAMMIPVVDEDVVPRAWAIVVVELELAALVDVVGRVLEVEDVVVVVEGSTMDSSDVAEPSVQSTGPPPTARHVEPVTLMLSAG